jgi:hypothetical protein
VFSQLKTNLAFRKISQLKAGAARACQAAINSDN